MSPPSATTRTDQFMLSAMSRPRPTITTTMTSIGFEFIFMEISRVHVFFVHSPPWAEPCPESILWCAQAAGGPRQDRSPRMKTDRSAGP